MLSASLEPLPGAQMVLLLPLRTPTASCSSTPQRTATSSAAGEGSVPPRDLDQLGLSMCVHHNLCDALSPRQAVPGVGVSLPPQQQTLLCIPPAAYTTVPPQSVAAPRPQLHPSSFLR